VSPFCNVVLTIPQGALTASAVIDDHASEYSSPGTEGCRPLAETRSATRVVDLVPSDEGQAALARCGFQPAP
jgi:hypothetical protein